jgi:hypothetical protein
VQGENIGNDKYSKYSCSYRHRVGEYNPQVIMSFARRLRRTEDSANNHARIKNS